MPDELAGLTISIKGKLVHHAIEIMITVIIATTNHDELNYDYCDFREPARHHCELHYNYYVGFSITNNTFIQILSVVIEESCPVVLIHTKMWTLIQGKFIKIIMIYMYFIMPL